ncbi:D-alanyl-D-alanine carboxypeptidase family protein [Streptomyces sp. NPDC054863]
MAGESPGKSEQRKSSGETASRESDPRLAVFRERTQEAAASVAEPEPAAEDAESEEVMHESADTEPEEEPAADTHAEADAEPASEKPEPEPEPESEPETEPEPEEATDDAPVAEDSRLRAAVAAWVATEEEPDAAAATDANANAEAESGADTDAKAAPETVAGAAGADGGGKGRSSDDSDSEEATDDEPDSSDSDDEPVPADGAEAPAAAKGDATSPDEPVGAPDASDESDSDDKSVSADDSDGTPAAPKGDAQGLDEPADDSEGSDGSDGPGSAAAAATGAAKAPDEAADADASSDAAADDDSDGSGESGEGDEPSEADGSDGSDDGKGVDQATAVFRSMPRSAPRTDQPTAMLKLPSKESKESKGAEQPKKSAGSKADRPESDTERTSTFVPLKPDGVRPSGPPRKPGRSEAQSGAQPAQQGRPAWAAGPQPAPAAAAGSGLPEAERTKQQPLPPKPPLDLLAELTNKPAPPETPVRTTVRRFKIWTPLVLLVLVVFAVVQFVRPLPDTQLALSATPSYTFEGGRTEMPWPGEGQSAIEVEGVGSMGTEGAQKPAPIASMAKAMTAYVILKDHPITGKETGPKITVDQAAEDDGKKGDESTAQIKKDQEYTQRQMLMMLMIPSGNNVARLLGRWDAGSEEKFLEKMNAAAKDLGMTNTKYTDSSGFDKGTVSTPVDQIKLGRAVMENDIFRKIVDMPEVEIPGLPGKIYNNNKILLQPGVNGIKTGSTTPAGGNLLFTASTIIDGKPRRIIGSVMNQTTGKILNEKLDKAIFDSLKLIKKAQEVVTSAVVVKKGEVVGYVDDGLGGHTPVVATKELKAVGWPGLKVDLALGAAAGKAVPHTGKAGDVVGEVTVGTGPGKVSAPVALQSELAEPGFGAKLTRLG